VTPTDARVAIVVATKDRATTLLATLERLRALPEHPRIVVVDNGSADGTPDAVRARHPDVEVVELSENLGAGARTVGARHLDAPYVAFSDDDSWWAPGALARAADLLDEHPQLAVLAARVLVGEKEQADPVCIDMAASPLPPRDRLPGPPVLGFVACGSVVRRSAFLEVGGFHARYGIGGEEELLALDLAASGWALAYVGAVVAHHHPAPSRDQGARRRRQFRNSLWSTWLRRPPLSAMRRTASLAARLRADSDARAGFADAVRGLRWVLRERRAIPPEVERGLRSLER
jgi:GT2 family glycosyltransferase